MRIVFFGTADLAAASLAALAGDPQFELVGVVTQPDRPKGRDLRLQPSAVKVEALRLKVPVLQPERARSPEFIEELARLRPDLIAVAAYGQILPQAILDLPRHGCLNVHTSLLPKFRGAAPIQWAILEGEPETGVTIMRMDAGLDTGEILKQEATPILPSDNGQSLHDRLARIGGELLVRTIPEYVSGTIIPEKQPQHGASYARKISKEDGRIDWNQPARVLWNRIRAFYPWPGAYTFLPDTPRQPLLKIWEASVVDLTGLGSAVPGEIVRCGLEELSVACGEQALRILSLQREGGKRLDISQFLRGFPMVVGQKFVG